jgi:NAD-specific glutamate dehydrogenase
MFRAGQLAPLSQSLPMLEHMGVQVLEERPVRRAPLDGAEIWIDDFGMSVPGRTRARTSTACATASRRPSCGRGAGRTRTTTSTASS